MLFVMSIHLSKELVFSNIYIESFRMPCYFFICGVFFSTKYPFQVFLRKKLNSLIIPLVFFDLLYIVLQLLFNYNNIYNIVIKRLISPFNITNGPLWFLLCLFNAYLIFYFIKTYSKRFIHPNLLTFILVVIFSMGGFYLSRLHFHGLRIVPPFFLGASFTSLIFIYIGSFSKRFILQKNKYDYIFCLSFISIFILTEYLYGPFHIDFSWNEFSNNYFIIAFIGIIGSLMIIYISKLIIYQY